MAKGDPTTQTNSNTSPQWQQLANSNISYPTSIVPQQQMGQMRPGMGSQFQRPGMSQMGSGMMGSGTGQMNTMQGQQQPSPTTGGMGNPFNPFGGGGRSIGSGMMPSMNSGMGSMASSIGQMGTGMNPYQQSYGMGQQLGRSIGPMLRSPNTFPMSSMAPQQSPSNMMQQAPPSSMAQS